MSLRTWLLRRLGIVPCPTCGKHCRSERGLRQHRARSKTCAVARAMNALDAL